MEKSVIQDNSRFRLEYLDGIRALAAIYVVFYHIYLELQIRVQGHKLKLSPLMMSLTNWMGYGHLAVDVFIVLSGYVLMLPVVRSTKKSLRSDYFLRRARRILPPYYAALVLSLLVGVVAYKVQSFLGNPKHATFDTFTPTDVLTHLFLIHNLKRAWIYQINSSMWSVATEWQIYFFFPLFLLPIWRKLGIVTTLLAAFAVGLVVHYLLHGRIDTACPWYVGLFALGMASAQIGFSSEDRDKAIRAQWPWPVLCTVALAIAVYLCQLPENWWQANLSIIDTLVGIVTACILIFCTNWLTGDKTHSQPSILKLFEFSPLVRIGIFSYSIYLVHEPVIAIVSYSLVKFRLSSTAILFVLLFVALPLAIFLAYFFHLLFEKPFMQGFSSKKSNLSK